MADELGESAGRQAVRRDRREQSEHRETLAGVDVLHLVEEAGVPPNYSPRELVRLTPYEEQCELERLRQRDKLEL